MWLLAWPCQLQGKKYLWSSLKFPQAIKVSQGGVPNWNGGFTTCHSRDTSENSVNLPRNDIFSHCLSSKSKAPHPQEIWKNHWPGFKWSLCLYLLQHCRVLGNVLKKRLWGLPESWPLGTVIFEAEIMWTCLGGSERVRKDHVSQSLSEGKRRVHPQPGKAVLDRFSNLGTELPVTLDFWFSVELFFYLYDFSWTFFISIWFWQGR